MPHGVGVSALVVLGVTHWTSPAIVAGLMVDGMNGKTMMTQKKNALDVQIGGEHYKKWKIQPAEFCHANSIPFLEGNVIKYVIRHRDKLKLEDLRKAKHYLELIAEMEYGVVL